MRTIISVVIILITSPFSVYAQQQVSVEQAANGWILKVDGVPFIINGMNWDYYPIGTNYEYHLWEEESAFIQKVLDHEMGLLRDAGVNAIRVYAGIPPKWISYIYQNFGIYTMVNHTFGRYGLTIDGEWMPNTDYANENVREYLLAEAKQMVKEYQHTEGLLLYLLGNENNYGLFWEGAETEDIPVEDRASTQKAHAMYALFNEAILEIKALDESRPVAFCNGDTQFLEVIADKVPDADIFGTNTYRGISFTDLYEEVATIYRKPVMLTEFGSDALNALTEKEDQKSQAHLLLGNWQEVYVHAAGLGGFDNSIGGFTFQFSDGWWKFGQTRNLDKHDINASWSNGGYEFDYREGVNNMNEEWFGVFAKGPENDEGIEALYPRASYYILQKVHEFEPYSEGVNQEKLEHHFNSISVEEAIEKAASKTNSNH